MIDYDNWHNIVTGGNTLLPFDKWSTNTNLHKLWNSRIKPDDVRYISCDGKVEIFVRKVYDWLDNHLDTFLQEVYKSGFMETGWRNFDQVTNYDENSIANTANNPGYFRNICSAQIVECGGDGDRSLCIRDSIIRTLNGEVRKTFTMPAIWKNIETGKVGSNMVLTFNKSCKLPSIFSPNVYRYLLNRMHKHQLGKSILFGTASWGVPVVASIDCGYNTVGIVDVQDGVLDACHDIHNEFTPNYMLQTYHTQSEVMDKMIVSGWDHIISCPPYYDLEVYGGSNKQSTDLYTTYNDWLENYWRKTVLSSKNLLSKNGIFAFVMGYHVRYQYMSRDMVEIAKQEGFELIEEVKIVPKRKTANIYLSPVEKYEVCSFFRKFKT